MIFTINKTILLLIIVLTSFNCMAISFSDCMSSGDKCRQSFKPVDSKFSAILKKMKIGRVLKEHDRLYSVFNEHRGRRSTEPTKCRFVLGDGKGNPLKLLDFTVSVENRDCGVLSYRIAQMLNQNHYLRCGKDRLNGKMIRWSAVYILKYGKWQGMSFVMCREESSLKERECWIEKKRISPPYSRFVKVRNKSLNQAACLDFAKDKMDCTKERSRDNSIHSLGVIWGDKERTRSKYSLMCATSEEVEKQIKDEYEIKQINKVGLFSLLASREFTCEENDFGFRCNRDKKKYNATFRTSYIRGTRKIKFFEVAYRNKVAHYSEKGKWFFDTIKDVIGGGYLDFNPGFAKRFKESDIAKKGFWKFESGDFIVRYSNSGFSTSLHVTLPTFIQNGVRKKQRKNRRTHGVVGSSSMSKEKGERIIQLLEKGKMNSLGRVKVQETGLVGGKRVVVRREINSAVLYYANSTIFLADNKSKERETLTWSKVYGNTTNYNTKRWVREYSSNDIRRREINVISIDGKNVKFRKEVQWNKSKVGGYLGDMAKVIEFEGQVDYIAVEKQIESKPNSAYFLESTKQKECLKTRIKNRGVKLYYGFDFKTCEKETLAIGNNTIDSSSFVGLKSKKIACRGCKIKFSSFEGGSFQNVDFSGVTFENVSFKGADLSGASFDFAILRNVDFELANLQNSSFVSAIVESGNFNSSDLRKANLYETKLTGCRFKKANLKYSQVTDEKIRSSFLAKEDSRHAYLMNKFFPVCGNNKEIPIYSDNKKIIDGANLVNCYAVKPKKYELDRQQISFFEVTDYQGDWIRLKAKKLLESHLVSHKAQEKEFWIRAQDFHTPYSITDGNITVPASFLQPTVRPRNEWLQNMNVPKIFGSKSICCNASHQVRMERFFYPPYGFDVEKIKIIKNGKLIDPNKCPNLC